MVTNEEGVSTELNNSIETKVNPFDFQLSKNSLITILICTGLSVLFMRTGILSFLFLAPIGYAVIVTGSILFPFLFAAFTNLIIDLFTRSAAQGYTENNFADGTAGSGENLLIQIIYFTSMFFIFIWIMGAKNPRTAYRLLAGSAAGAVIFIIFIYKTDLFSIMERVIEEISLQASAEGGEAINPVFNGLLPAENITEMFNKVLIRGAAFFSILLIFFINRHMSYALVRLIKKQRADKPLTEFYAPHNAVWVLAGAFASVLFALVLKIELLEILAWNVFVIFASLFLAQGAGILLHLLSKRFAFLRIGASILFIFVLLSPIGLAVIFLLLILGVIENWIPIRKGRNPGASYSEAN